MATTTLHQPEAVLLAHALVARLAEEAGARILFIKGPTAIALGVRPDRPSTDVDVLTDRGGFVALCAALGGCGWQRRNTDTGLRLAADLAFEHSAHFIHAEWPCDLDVHYSFPGFLAPEAVVFEALWATHTTVEVAGCVVPSPSVAGQALVVALHALRDPSRATSQQDLGHVTTAVDNLDDQQRRELIGLALETGAADTAEPILLRAGASPSPHTPSPLLRSWMLRQRYSEAAGSLWIEQFSRATWRERPRVLMRAAVPRREVLLSSHLVDSASRRDVALLHLRRWRHGIAALPRSMSIVRSLRKSFRD
ncbi:MAG: nucleotidyltransferase family protein [Pedococcus sp.]